MISRIARRKQAYQFILEKTRKLEAEFSYNMNKFSEGNDIIPLAELEKLKRGITDPSIELITVLQKLLRPVASEAEIEDKLLKPFEPRKSPEK